MKKILLLFVAIMMVSTGLWAQERKEVSYRYPVYHTEGDPTSGIKEWETEEREAIILTGSDSQVTLSESWYVITGTDVVYDKGIVIHGNVNLILADGAILMAMGGENSAGIEVSGQGYSLTIYGQDNQLGQLVATGNIYAAGIGGGAGQPGSNITINGGIVTANGGDYAAGIGGGQIGSASNITINGGTITANGGMDASGIGGGEGGSSLNIFVATDLIIKADYNNPPTTVITNTGADLASSLAGKQYVKIEKDLTPVKTAAIDDITEAIKGVSDADILAIATTAITDINNATTEDDINSIKTFALTKINAIAAILSARQGIKNTELNAWIDAAIADIKKGRQDATPTIDDIMDQILYMINLFQDGKAEGKADLLGSMATEQDGPAVEVIKGEKKVILYSPDKVNFIKVETEN